MIPDWAGYCEFRRNFEQVMDERYYSIEWLDEQILTGAARFWRSGFAAIIAEIRTFPTGAKDVHGLIAAGDLDAIINELIPQAEAWGREQGCIAAVVESRPAWVKALAPYDYELHQCSVRKEL